MKRVVTRVIMGILCILVLAGGVAFGKIKSKASDEVSLKENQEKEESKVDEEKYIKMTEELVNSLLNKEAEKFCACLDDSINEMIRDSYQVEFK